MSRPDPADRVFAKDPEMIPLAHEAETLLAELRALTGADLRPALMPEALQPGWPTEAAPLLARYWQISRRLSVLNSRRMSRQLTRFLEGLNGDTEPTGPMRRWWRDRY